MLNIHNPLLKHSVKNYGKSSLAFKFLLFGIFVSIGRPQNIFPFLNPFHLGDISVAGMMISFLFLDKKQMNEKVLSYTETKLMILIFVLMIVLVPFATISTESFYFIKNQFLKTFIFFVFSVKLIRTIKNIEYTALTLIFCSLFLSFSVIVLKGSSSIEVTRAGRVAIGGMYDPNDLSMIMVVSLPIAIMYSFHSKGTQRLLGIVASIMGMSTIMLTQSRGGFLGLVVITMMIFFNRSRFKIKYLIILLTLGVMFVSFTPGSYWDRLSTLKQGSSASGRSLIWERSIQMFYNNPFGYGAGNFASAYGWYVMNDPSMYMQDQTWKTAHNFLLIVLVELGVLGFAIYVYLIFKTYSNFRKIKKIVPSDTVLYQHAEFLRISLVGFIVCAFFLSQSYSPFLMTLIAISSVMINVIAKEIENVKHNGKFLSLLDE